jgi:AcrR family transcriptional regulator
MGRSMANSEARRRILETADRLFYRDGIRAVGVDRVVAEADVAKMTLYAHFASKDDLILAVLQYREEGLAEFFRSAVDWHAKRTRNRVKAFFAALKDLFESPGFRGCPFQNAAAELADPDHPGSRYVREQKKRFAALIANVVREAVGKESSQAAAVALLVEGAVVSAVIHGSAEFADVACAAALKLIEAG